jgi:hypothetical protein
MTVSGGDLHAGGTGFAADRDGNERASADREPARLGVDDGVIARMDRREGPVLDRLVEECRRSVAEDGAEAILLGCTCMAKTAPLIVERFHEARVIEAARSALRARRVAAPARRNRSGLAGVLPALVDTWVAGTPSSLLPDADECNACAAVESGEQLDRV